MYLYMLAKMALFGESEIPMTLKMHSIYERKLFQRLNGQLFAPRNINFRAVLFKSVFTQSMELQFISLYLHIYSLQGLYCQVSGVLKINGLCV